MKTATTLGADVVQIWSTDIH